MTAAKLGLFEGPAPRLRTISASAPFLDLLADAMAEALLRDDDPFAMADALVLAPNRRAAQGLIDALARRLGGAALLPSIRPLGDPYSEDDPDVLGDEAFDVPPPIESMRRRMELAALIRRRDAAQGGVDDPVRALAMADELARLLDAAATVDDVAWEKLPTLVSDLDLARHWGSSAQFLEIVAAHWPAHLAEQGLSDVAHHGAALRSALAERWERQPTDRPVIIAGSTGSVATTRRLMRAVARLPRGVVVFPGLDLDLDAESWSLVGDQHPQFALKETLAALGVTRAEVRPLGEEASSGRARRVLMREALAPAQKTADWLARLEAAGGPTFVNTGAAGVRLIEAETENEEAMAIALLLREALETPGRTAALATPDAGLARRVEAKLARWGVAPQVSHGKPLRESEAGALIALLCELADDEGEPVALAALIKHPRIARADAGAVTALEHRTLRGPRRHRTLADLAAHHELAASERAHALAERLRSALNPLAVVRAREAVTLDVFADALTQTAETLAGGEAWAGRDGERVANLLREAIAFGDALGPMTAYAASRVVLKVMDATEAPPLPGGEARLAIWGPLEARLQRRDLMILGGLNEGVWPAPAPEDPFLSRGMRAELGLPLLDQRIGLAAHDFAQLANAPDVVMTRALRRDGAPTLASRWLWRLQTLIKGAGATLPRASAPLSWARTLDAPQASRSVKVPRPRPPSDARLKRLSVTQVETLIRDPYAIYARRILGLEVLKPIGAEVGPAERGTAIHKAVERLEDRHDHALLRDLLDEELRRAGVSPERRAAERSRLEQSVRMLLSWLQAREQDIAVYREIKGQLELQVGVTLTGTADRIETGPRGAAILDFKTGSPPSDAQVASGLAPQLLLEAAMLKRGAFEGAPAAIARELIYWRFGGANPAPRIVHLDDGVGAASEKALAELNGMLARYADAAQPFLSKPRVQFIKRYADYDHLARRKEWADAELDE